MKKHHVAYASIACVAAIASFVYFSKSAGSAGMLATGDRSQRPDQAGMAAKPAHADDEGSMRAGIQRRSEVSPDAARAGIRPGQRNAAYLPIESTLIQQGALSAAAIDGLLSNRGRFQSMVRVLGEQSAVDPEAVQLTRGYRNALERKLGESGLAGQFSEFACGLSLCAGEIRGTGSVASTAALPDAFLGNRAYPIHVFTDRHLDTGGGQYSYLFVFSVDPSANRVRLPPARPKS